MFLADKWGATAGRKGFKPKSCCKWRRTVLGFKSKETKWKVDIIYLLRQKGEALNRTDDKENVEGEGNKNSIEIVLLREIIIILNHYIGKQKVPVLFRLLKKLSQFLLKNHHLTKVQFHYFQWLSSNVLPAEKKAGETVTD